MKSLLFLFLLIFLSFLLHAQAQEGHVNQEKEIEQLLNIDSLEIVAPTDSLNQELKTFHSKLKSIEDSLAIKSRLPDSLRVANPLDTITQKAVQKLETSKAKVNAVVDSLQQKLQVKVPDSLKQFLPEEAELLQEAGVPELELEPLRKVEGLTEIEELKSLQGLQGMEGIDGLGNFPELQELPQMDQLNEVSDQLKEAKEMLPQTNKLTETAENEAKNLKGIKALEAQKGEIGDMPGGLDQVKDQEHFKEELVNKAKEKAVDHFAGHADKLQAAQSKLADIKRKYPEGVSSIKDLPKRRPNPLKGKPFKERLVLGLTVQIHPDKIPNVDLSPFAGFKVSPRFSFGLGGNYRLVSKPKFKGLTSDGAVYGYRAFTELMVHKGFFLHAEYEMLKTLVRDSIHFGASEKILEKEWVDGLLIGIGKEYKIGGLVKGNMQVLYNFLNEPNSPYKEKVMVRFGFSFQLKDKIKKPDLAPEVEKAKEKGKRSLRKLKDKNLSGSLK